jgi:hypothetical protein
MAWLAIGFGNCYDRCISPACLAPAVSNIPLPAHVQFTLCLLTLKSSLLQSCLCTDTYASDSEATIEW